MDRKNELLEKADPTTELCRSVAMLAFAGVIRCILAWYYVGIAIADIIE